MVPVSITEVPGPVWRTPKLATFSTTSTRAPSPASAPTDTVERCVPAPMPAGWTYLRVPYPLGFYQRGMDGRIDDPNGGWKARGLYANYGTHLVWHTEGGKGTTGKVVKFQIRPDPLAR